MEYKIEDAFNVGNITILSFDRERDANDYSYSDNVVIDGISKTYCSQHMKNWISIEHDDNPARFIGKNIMFK
ncbi:MAG: hypothetical protein LKF53_02035 [Solobacterium sp.]|jgi:hypothetical protein|nr:hypothetical protein [Solobacterium sp.]MCH4205158.1 hypothetical protein [Solobacterium sp.]MCH4226751.1 hypothetical protein [Solobacterium sp.]MCH4281920.1 hypothetical protein [Solobacterium sp.]